MCSKIAPRGAPDDLAAPGFTRRWGRRGWTWNQEPALGARRTVNSLGEAHDLLRLLIVVAQAGGLMSREAARLAREVAARIPLENCRIARMSLDMGAAPEVRVRP
jgi:uncharacterized protein DUF6417